MIEYQLNFSALESVRGPAAVLARCTQHRFRRLCSEDGNEYRVFLRLSLGAVQIEELDSRRYGFQRRTLGVVDLVAEQVQVGLSPRDRWY